MSPDKALLIGQDLVENAKIKNSNETFSAILKQWGWESQIYQKLQDSIQKCFQFMKIKIQYFATMKNNTLFFQC